MNTFSTVARDKPEWQSVDADFALLPPNRKAFRWLGDEQPRPRLASRRFADAQISELVVPPVRVAQAASLEGDMPYHLVCLLDGYGRYRCKSGDFTQASGDIVLIDGAEACEVTSPVATHVLRWSLPRHALAPMLPLGNLTTTRLPGSQAINGVLSRHAIELARAAGDIPIEAQRGFLLHLCSLIGLTLTLGADRPSGRGRAYRVQMRQRVLAYVESHLRDPDLTARRAAEDLGISTRRLHALLEESDFSFSDLVAQRRVQQSLRLLQTREPDAVPITEIAYLSGFEDLSTYYRRFRRYMHMTPGDWRRRFR